MTVRILIGDTRERMAELPAGSVQCIVTSPPYFGLRDYGHAGQIGQEPTPDAFVAELVAVFREARRVLADDGTLWLNLGDSYAATTKGSSGKGEKQNTNRGTLLEDRSWRVPDGLKPKDLIGIPWLVAFALRADGWFLRSDIIWAKPNAMPESVTDRPTKAHEYVFLLSKSARYFWDADAVAEPLQYPDFLKRTANNKQGNGELAKSVRFGSSSDGQRNIRSVWNIATQPYSGAHFATMPPTLAERCILAGSRKGDTVLDPFGGAGTTGLVADRLGRNAILVELNPQYAALAQERLSADAGLFAEVGAA